jgi:DNA mismatch endonuclease (patch repair protein)
MDTLSKTARAERMSRVRGKHTKPEMIVRRLLHGQGYRYRLHARDLPGSPDIVFRGRRKAIYVHGCFWHRHPDETCKLARLPKSRREFWLPKLEGNRERDLRNQQLMIERGWSFLLVWECEISNRKRLVESLQGFLESDPPKC